MRKEFNLTQVERSEKPGVGLRLVREFKQAVYDIDAEWWNDFELQPTQVQGVLEISRLLFLNKHHHIDWNVSNLLFY